MRAVIESQPWNKVPKMVGAAGFEPAPCSTQNCRATRLRYTPPVAALDSFFACGQQASNITWIDEIKAFVVSARPSRAGRLRDGLRQPSGLSDRDRTVPARIGRGAAPSSQSGATSP